MVVWKGVFLMRWLKDFGTDMPITVDDIRRMIKKQQHKSNKWVWVTVIIAVMTAVAGMIWWISYRDEKMTEEYYEYFDDEEDWEDDDEYDDYYEDDQSDEDDEMHQEVDDDTDKVTF